MSLAAAASTIHGKRLVRIMAFSLSMAPIDGMISDEEAVGLRELLAQRNIAFLDEIDHTKFENVAPFEVELFEDEDEDEDEDERVEPQVLHWEAGWGDWSEVQALVTHTLGHEAAATVNFIHAFHGVAVPGEIENTMVGTPTVRGPVSIRPVKTSFLATLFGKTRRETKEANAIFQPMIERYGGGYANLIVVSSNRLLRELDATVLKLGLQDHDLGAMYERASENDAEVGQAYLLIARTFIRATIENKALCWFIK